MLAIIYDSQTQWNFTSANGFVSAKVDLYSSHSHLQQIDDGQIVMHFKRDEFVIWIFLNLFSHFRYEIDLLKIQIQANEESPCLAYVFHLLCGCTKKKIHSLVSTVTLVSVTRQTYRNVKLKSNFSIRSFENDFWDSFFVSLEKMACTLCAIMCKVLNFVTTYSKCQAI